MGTLNVVDVILPRDSEASYDPLTDRGVPDMRYGTRYAANSDSETA